MAQLTLKNKIKLEISKRTETTTKIIEKITLVLGLIE